MEIYLKANIKTTKKMEKVKLLLQMEIYLKVNIKTTKEMDKANLLMQMEIYMKANIKITKKMALVNLNLQMETSKKVSGMTMNLSKFETKLFQINKYDKNFCLYLFN